jgi:hypothetical protein
MDTYGPVLILGWVVGAVALAGVGCYVSAQKHRPVGEGALLGLVLGPLGVLLAALLPTLEPSSSIVTRMTERGFLVSGWKCKRCGTVNDRQWERCAACSETRGPRSLI